MKYEKEKNMRENSRVLWNKILKITFIAVIMLGLAVILFGCCGDDTEEGDPVISLQVTGQQYVFDLHEEFTLGESVVLTRITDGQAETITAEDVTTDITGYNPGMQGVYDVVVTLNGTEITYSYQVLVFDSSNITAHLGDTLEDIAFPSELNLRWQNPSLDVGAVGAHSFVLIYTSSNGVETEINATVNVEKLENAWAEAEEGEPYGVSIEGWTYGQEPNAPEIGDTIYKGTEADAVVVEYYTNVNNAPGKKLDNVPTNAGDYFLVVTIKGNDTYADFVDFASFKIEKIFIEVEAKQEGKYALISKVYDGGHDFDSASYFTDEDFYTVTSAGYDGDLSIIDINVSSNGTFYDADILPSAEVGSGKTFIQNIELSSEIYINYAFSGDNQSSHLIFVGEITAGTATVSENPTVSSVAAGTALSEIELVGGVVTYNLVEGLAGITTTPTVISGTWSWESSEQTVDATGNFNAVFTPDDTNIPAVTVAINIEVSEVQEAA